MILILDFGSQYTQLIARRVREANVYCEIHPYSLPLERIKQLQPEGIILSGGPASVYAKDAPMLDARVLDVPVAPCVVGLILGPLAEQQFRRALAISQGDPMVFFTHPLSLGLLVTALLMSGLFELLTLNRRASSAQPISS